MIQVNSFARNQIYRCSGSRIYLLLVFAEIEKCSQCFITAPADDGKNSIASRINRVKFCIRRENRMVRTDGFQLSQGKHKVALRVWDVNNNVRDTELSFVVHENGAADREVFATQNPTTSGTTFIASFYIDTSAGVEVAVEVYDIAGRRIWHKSQTVQGANYVSVPWRLTDTAGTPVPSGIYMYRAIIDGKETKARKLVIL